jgi:hypothetical protein
MNDFETRHTIKLSNDQLTDGGPSVTPELPSCVAGPQLGALGSAIPPALPSLSEIEAARPSRRSSVRDM